MDVAFTGALARILDQGLLGAVLLLSLYVNWRLWKENGELRDKWVADLKETNEKVIGPLGEINNTVEMTLTMLQRRNP
jgi:hypothetical protein